MSGRDSGRCLGCSSTPWKCRASYVYVMFEPETGLTKIGSSVSPGQRAAKLRRERGTRIRLIDRRIGACQVDIGRIEVAVQAFVGEQHRVGGTADWFRVPPHVAVAALHAVIPQEWDREAARNG